MFYVMGKYKMSCFLSLTKSYPNPLSDLQTRNVTLKAPRAIPLKCSNQDRHLSYLPISVEGKAGV